MTTVIRGHLGGSQKHSVIACKKYAIKLCSAVQCDAM